MSCHKDGVSFLEVVYGVLLEGIQFKGVLVIATKSAGQFHVPEWVNHLVGHVGYKFVEVVERSVDVDNMGPFLLLRIGTLKPSHLLSRLQIGPLEGDQHMNPYIHDQNSLRRARGCRCRIIEKLPRLQSQRCRLLIRSPRRLCDPRERLERSRPERE